MDKLKKYLPFIILTIAAGAIGYLLIKPKKTTLSSGAVMNADGSNENAGPKAIPGDLGKIINFVNAIFSKEDLRFRQLLQSWKTRNIFKISSGKGYGDFLSGDMPPTQWPELLQNVQNYQKYLIGPDAFKPGTKARVKRRYIDAAESVRKQVQTAIDQYFNA